MKIIVLVDEFGASETIVKGVVGSSCLDKSKFLTDSLGVITSNTTTEEYDGVQLFTDNTVGVPEKQVRRVKNTI